MSMLNVDYIAKYNSLKEDVGAYSKYYHLNSIKNFINYLNKFGGLYYKSEAEKLLDEYFECTSERGILTVEDGKEIFYTIVQPLGNIYNIEFKFSLYTGFDTILLWIGLLSTLAFLFKLKIYVYILIGLICLLVYLPGYLKYRKNKVYGFNF